MIYRAYKYRLWPTDAQAESLNRCFAAVRQVYNAALEQRRTYGRRKGSDAFGRDSRFNAPRQAREINFRSQAGRPGLLDDPELRWITETPRDCLDAALRDLDKAFDAFFAGRAGFPSFRSADRNNSLSFRAWCRKIVAGRSVSTPAVIFGQNCVTLPKFGRVRYRRHRKFYGDPKTVEIIREGAEFYVILTCAQPDREIDHHGDAVGVDLGVAMPVALSTGEHVTRDPGLAALDQRARAEARKLSRMKTGSKRRERQKHHLAAIRRKQARRRAGRAHRITTELTRRFALIAIEDLRVSNMTASARGTVEEPGRNVHAKSGLNREILNVAPFAIRQQLTYKAARTGSRIIAVDPKNTSRTCPVCGYIATENRQSQSAFLCIACGHADHADINAARTILARALASAGATARRETPSESGCGSATSNGHVSCLQPASTLEISGRSGVCLRKDADAADPRAGCGITWSIVSTLSDSVIADPEAKVIVPEPRPTG